MLDAVQNGEGDAEYKVIEGLIVEEWEDEDGTIRREAVDGGTTATVIALVDGATLVHAQVGDSSALLGGTIMEEEGEEGGGEVTFEELMEEHAATNVKEYERMLGEPRGKLVQFVYDVHDLIDEARPNGPASHLVQDLRPLILSFSHPLPPSRTLSHPLAPSRTLSHPLPPSPTLSSGQGAAALQKGSGRLRARHQVEAHC